MPRRGHRLARFALVIVVASDSSTPMPKPGYEAWLARQSARWSPGEVRVLGDAFQTLDRHCAPSTEGGGPAAGLAVAELLADLGMDHPCVVAGVLHEGVACGLSLETVRARFEGPVAGLVAGACRLDSLGELQPAQRHEVTEVESLRRLLLATARDVRVVLIELASRTHFMRGLDRLPPDARRRAARDTLAVFAPLANRLGVARLRWVLEDLAFRHLEPDVYRELARAVEERRAQRERYVAEVVALVVDRLAAAGIPARADGRVKHLYSIWRKMRRKGLPFEQIFDVRAVRVIVGSISECYGALGVVHSLWTPIEGEFDDYVAHPKPNGYQSLHTAVVGPEGRTVEVQIRTEQMNRHAEYGVAAHWRYKEPDAAGRSMDQVAWLRQMLEASDVDHGDLWDEVRAQALADRVFAVTPKGNVLELPRGATVLDFAYRIHTDVGHRCRGAKVNGRIVPLTHRLGNAEVVEILTSRAAKPSRDWLNPHLGYLATSRARSKVRHWFREQDRERNVAGGRAALERELHRLGAANLPLERIASEMGFGAAEDLCAAVGRGDVAPAAAVARLQELVLPKRREGPEAPPPPPRAGAGAGGVEVRGVGNLLTQIARCCSPLPEDPISGYITVGRGVTIHRRDCRNLLRLAAGHPERVIEVDWGPQEEERYRVEVRVDYYPREGLLRDLTAVLASERTGIQSIASHTDKGQLSQRLQLVLEVKDLTQLGRVLDRIGQLPNVAGARRVV